MEEILQRSHHDSHSNKEAEPEALGVVSVERGGSCRIHYFDPSQTNRKLTKMLIIGPWDRKNPPRLEFKSLLHN